MSFDKVLTIPFRNGGFIKLLIGGLLEFIPVVGWFLVTGFMLKCYEHGTANREDMPEWSEWGQKFADGFMIFLISIIYMIVPLLFLPRINRFVEYGMHGYFDFSMIAVPALLYLVFCFALPMALSNYAVNRTFASAFNLGYIFRLIGAAPGSYIGAFFLYWFACILVLLFVVFVPIIGWLFSIFAGFYLMCVSALLFGSVYNRAIASIGRIKSAGPTTEKALNCPRCGGQIVPSDKFCKKCGSKIDIEPMYAQGSGSLSASGTAQSCPGCGKQALSSSKFCEFCGIRMSLASVVVPASVPDAVSDSNPSSVPDAIATAQEIAAGEAAPETARIDAASVETTMLRLEDEKLPVLESVSGDETIRVDKIEFILGRDDEKCNYTFSETVIGRLHAKIITLGGYYIVDLGSKNGTYINDQRIESNVNYELKENDQIRFAHKKFIFKISE